MNLKDRSSICDILPHAGDMCLLSELVDVTPEKIACISRSHLEADNPLRIQGKLPAIAGIEYASQVVALHGQIETLNRGSRPVIGFLASVRDVEIHATLLDEDNSELYIEASQIMRIEGAVTYDFSIRAGDRRLLSGRMTTKLMMEVPEA